MKSDTPSTAGAPADSATASELTVLRITDGLSAQAEITQVFGRTVRIVEVTLAGWTAQMLPCPVVIWVDQPTATQVAVIRSALPRAGLMACVRRTAPPREVIGLIAHGADLVVRDEGSLLAAAALHSLARRLRHTSQPRDPSSAWALAG
jgi:hypothetical protein